jgi:hypothetical protein
MTAARRQLTGALLASLAAGAIAAMLLLAGAHGYVRSPLAGPVADGGWTDRSRGWFTARGVLGAEVDAATGRSYSWIGPSARISLPHLDRTQAYTATLIVDAARPADVAPPHVDVLVDGAPAGRFQTTNGDTAIAVTLPPRGTDRAVLTLQVDDTFTPSGDPRVLGVIIRDLQLAPASGHFSVAWSVGIDVAAAVALTTMAVLLCGVGAGLGALWASGIALALVWLTLQDGAFIGTYSESLFHAATGACALGVVIAALRARWPVLAGAPGWGSALGVVLAPTMIMLAVFTHPLATIGDGIFQLHRAQLVRSGSYFFTSITPRPFFEFPYAIGLYVSALPFWSAFPTELDQVHLLRGTAVIANAIVGLALYVAAYRQWRDRRAALFAAALWPFARAPIEALCNANLTNAFAQGLFGVAMGVVGWAAAGATSIASTGIAGLFLIGGYLSHFSTFSVGVPLAGAIAIVLVIGARGPDRRAGWWLLALGLVAAGVAYAVYYSHFTDVYRQTWARIAAHEMADAPGSAIAAPPATKFHRWWTGQSDDYGLPGIVSALVSVIGLVALLRRRGRDGLTLVLVGWLAVWVVFTALGILTSIQMRVNLAAAPLFVCLGAYGLAEIAARGHVGRMVAATLAVAIAVSGARLWLMCLGY